jgi:predicted nucleotidyltransferase
MAGQLDRFDGVLAEIVERLQPMRPVRILLFGSAARGEVDRLSDLDVIVVAESVAPRFLDRIADAYDLIDPRYALDILVYTPAEYEAMRAAGNSLIERAEREGRVLYERPAA